MTDECIPGVPKDLKGKSYTELLNLFQAFAKEKPGATNDEHIALGFMFLCNLRDGDFARRGELVQGLTDRLSKIEEALGVTPPCSNGSRTHDLQGQPVCPRCGWRPMTFQQNRQAPIPCSVALPREHEDVLFYVVAEELGRGWKIGERVPDGFFMGEQGKIWSSNDDPDIVEATLFSADQVTHWLPMPGEP